MSGMAEGRALGTKGLHLLEGWLLQTGGGGTLHRGRGGLLVTAG